MNRSISTLISFVCLAIFLLGQASTSMAQSKCTISFQSVVTNNPTGCSASEDGSICVTINGTKTIEFELSINGGVSWTYGKETICKEDLPAGNYNLQIREQSGCIVEYPSNPVILGVDNPITINDITSTPQSYSELGTIIVSAIGLAPIQYRINSGTWQTSEKFFDLEAGSYTIEVKDRNGCVVSDVVTVADERCPEFTATPTSETNCFTPNGTITITAPVGIRPLSYSIDNGSTWQSDSVFSDLSAGTYQLAVKSDNACVTYGSMNVATAFIAFSGSSHVVNISSCMGDATGEIVATAIGGSSPYSYSINNGSNWQPSGIFTGLTAGSYTAMVIDDFGCTDTTLFSISQPNHDTIDFVMAENVVGCVGDSTGAIAIDELFPAPPAAHLKGASATKSYSIDGGITWQSGKFFSNLPAGEYNAAIKVNSCVYPYYLNPIMIGEPDPVRITEVVRMGDYGNSSGKITITATGGGENFEYSIDGGTTFSFEETFTGLASGTYNLVVRDYNGCTADSSVSVPDWSVQITTVETTNTTCFGSATGSITITSAQGEGPISYSIDNGVTWQLSNLFENLTAIEYFIKVKDSNDIEKSWLSNPVNISQPDDISFSYRTYSPNCAGENSGSIRFRSVDGGTGSYSYSVDGGITYTSNYIATGLGAGYYYLFVKDENNCSKEYFGNPVEIIDPSLFEILGVELANNTSCTENGNGMITILLSSGGDPGQVSNPDGNPSFAMGSYYYSIDDSATWQQDNNIFTNLDAGSYNVWAKSPEGCVAEWKSNPVLIEYVNPISFKSIDVTHDDGRNNGVIRVDAVGGDSPYSYRLDEREWQTSDSFSNLAAGTYSLQVRDSDGCENSTEVTVDSIVYIPDENFKNYLLSNSSINTNGDEEIQKTEAFALNGTLNIGSLTIADLTGIEAFENITTLICSNNSLTSLDVSKNLRLTYVNCNTNSIAELILGNNTALTRINAYRNNLTSIDLSLNTNLTEVNVGLNNLTQLDVSKNLVLDKLSCYSNAISRLDLQFNVALRTLKCYENSLSYLDIRNIDYLNIDALYCKDNPDLYCVSVADVEYFETYYADEFDSIVTFSLYCDPIPDDETITNTSFNEGDTSCVGAYQTITVGDIAGNPVDFNIGSSTNLIAGTSIAFLPGVHISQGAYLSATITSDSSFCEMVEAIAPPIVATNKNNKSETIGITLPEHAASLSLKVFPNPNKGKFSVEINGFNRAPELLIYNSSGALVSRRQRVSADELYELNGFPAGLYFLKAWEGTKKVTQKIIVE